ncbi:MAG: 4,5-DOPA dioxygenase extradiol [Bacteroidota bacterium]
MSGISSFKALAETFPIQEKPMPVLFIGHGSPMNGIEANEFSNNWALMANDMPQPKAVLVVSAHWFTRGTHITAMDFPNTIHDFGGFPQELFNINYAAQGSMELAIETKKLITSTDVGLNHDWGLDHGAWTVVKHMYPNAEIPVLQLSIDYTKNAREHYDLAREIYQLRKRGVLILGSGNMVHNLRIMNWEMINGGGYDWALEINDKFKTLILNNQHLPLMNYQTLGKEAMLAIPTPEHYLPLMYTLGLKKEHEQISIFNDKAVGGSLTMTSVRVG